LLLRTVSNKIIFCT